jgi:CRP/FNR family transcriptional regulator, cyclic AMP receptor protein
VAAGSRIFSEGDEGTEMFGVREGEVELRKGDVVVARLEAGDVFGEMALIDRVPRSLTAVAATDCTIAAIDKREFLFLVHETPTFALHVMSTLAARIRAADPTV